MIDIGYKRCSICQELKPLTSFYVHWQTSDGRWKMCPDCHRETVRRGQAEARKKLKASETKDKQEPFVFHRHLIKELLDCLLANPGSTPSGLYWKIYETRSFITPPNYVHKYVAALEKHNAFCVHGGKYYLSPALEKGFIASKQYPGFWNESSPSDVV